MKYFFNSNGDYIGGFDAGSMELVPPGAVEVPNPPNHGLDRLVNGSIILYAPTPDPLELITAAVKSLPVEKRTDATWGQFMSQCETAIRYNDSESLAYLVNGFVTSDPDYANILMSAKQLFNIS